MRVQSSISQAYLPSLISMAWGHRNKASTLKKPLVFMPSLRELNTQRLCFTQGRAYHETSELVFWGAFSRCLLRWGERCQGVLLPYNVLRHRNTALITPRPSAWGSPGSASSQTPSSSPPPPRHPHNPLYTILVVRAL